MAKEYVPNYDDYTYLKELQNKCRNDYQTADKLNREIQGANVEHKFSREMLRKSCSDIELGRSLWAGKDADSFANTAKEILHELWQADEDYMTALRDIKAECDKKVAFYAEKILEVEKEMDAWSKAKHIWNAGVRGDMNG